MRAIDRQKFIEGKKGCERELYRKKDIEKERGGERPLKNERQKKMKKET